MLAGATRNNYATAATLQGLFDGRSQVEDLPEGPAFENDLRAVMTRIVDARSEPPVSPTIVRPPSIRIGDYFGDRYLVNVNKAHIINSLITFHGGGRGTGVEPLAKCKSPRCQRTCPAFQSPARRKLLGTADRDQQTPTDRLH